MGLSTQDSPKTCLESPEPLSFNFQDDLASKYTLLFVFPSLVLCSRATYLVAMIFFFLRLPTLPRNISSRDVIDQIHCLASELIKLTVVLVGEAFPEEEIWRPCEKEKKLQWYPKLLENSIAMSYEEYVKRKRQKTSKQTEKANPQGIILNAQEPTLG